LFVLPVNGAQEKQFTLSRKQVCERQSQNCVLNTVAKSTCQCVKLYLDVLNLCFKKKIVLAIYCCPLR